MNMTTVRTPEEIAARVEELRTGPDHVDFFGAQHSSLVLCLPYEQARAFLKAGIPESDWTPEEPLTEARNYMEFAIGKATGHRGLSAGRSIDHYKGWLWILGLDTEVDWEAYPNYGAPILKQIAGLIEAEWPEDEDLNRMAEGEPCRDDCQDGCGW